MLLVLFHIIKDDYQRCTRPEKIVYYDEQRVKNFLKNYCTMTIEELKAKYNLGKRDFKKINLPYNNLNQVKLDGIELTDSNLEACSLQRSSLIKAYLTKVNFQKANLMAANLRGANLVGANLAGADLTGACLEEALLIEANLSQADLSGADLSKAVIFNTYLHQAAYSNKTKFPQGFDPEKAGMKRYSAR